MKLSTFSSNGLMISVNNFHGNNLAKPRSWFPNTNHYILPSHMWVWGAYYRYSRWPCLSRTAVFSLQYYETLPMKRPHEIIISFPTIITLWIKRHWMIMMIVNMTENLKSQKNFILSFHDVGMTWKDFQHWWPIPNLKYLGFLSF